MARGDRNGARRAKSGSFATDPPRGSAGSFTFPADRWLSWNDHNKRIEAGRYGMSPGSSLLWLVLFMFAVLVGSICRVVIVNYSEQIDFILDFFDKGWDQ
jgi:hypothetical protein